MLMDKIAGWMQTLPLDTALWVIVLVFIALDVIFGTVKAWANKELSSSVARQGVMHKMGFIAAMLLCNIIDIAQSVADFGYSVPTTMLCSIMIVACEVMSICEHIRDMNPNINLSFLENDTQEDMRDDGDADYREQPLKIQVEGMDELIKTTNDINDQLK